MGKVHRDYGVPACQIVYLIGWVQGTIGSALLGSDRPEKEAEANAWNKSLTAQLDPMLVPYQETIVELGARSVLTGVCPLGRAIEGAAAAGSSSDLEDHPLQVLRQHLLTVGGAGGARDALVHQSAAEVVAAGLEA